MDVTAGGAANVVVVISVTVPVFVDLSSWKIGAVTVDGRNVDVKVCN